MTTCDVSKLYSVLLLYPEWANESGTETYYAFVEAPEPAAAVTEARWQAVEELKGLGFNPDDFAPLLVTEGRNESLVGPANPDRVVTARLSCCPLCGGEIQATVERYYSLRGGGWIESGVDGDSRLYCANDCDLSGYAGQIPEIG